LGIELHLFDQQLLALKWQGRLIRAMQMEGNEKQKEAILKGVVRDRPKRTLEKNYQ